MAERARIIRAADLSQMRMDAATVSDAKAEAEALLSAARQKAEADRDEIIAGAEAEARQKATGILDEAERTAQTQLGALEQEVSALVATTVAKVIGEMDQTKAVKAATKTALAELSAQTSAKIRAAPGVYRAVTEAVAEEESAGRKSVDRVTQDEALTEDRVILSSARGHTEIGLSDQVEAVTEPWRGEA